MRYYPRRRTAGATGWGSCAYIDSRCSVSHLSHRTANNYLYFDSLIAADIYVNWRRERAIPNTEFRVDEVEEYS